MYVYGMYTYKYTYIFYIEYKYNIFLKICKWSNFFFPKKQFLKQFSLPPRDKLHFVLSKVE